jgi:hypothetical protein
LRGVLRPESARGTARTPYSISSNDCSPHGTVRFGSGFAGFCTELSYTVVCTIFVPAGTCFGVANVYVVCQLKSYFGTDSSSSSRPSG